MPTLGPNIGLSIAAGANDLRVDPFQSCNFLVEIEGLLVGGFSSCKGLEVEIEEHEYREGGVNDFVHRFAGRAHHPRLVFQHGLSPVDGLWNWHQDTVNGIVKRRNGTVYLLNSERVPAIWWEFKQALPLKWTGPELNAATASIAFESLEVAHQGLSRPRLARIADDIAGELSSTLNLPGGFF